MFRMMVAAACVVVLGGCAGTQGFVVDEADKDPNASFDGGYTANVVHPGGVQPMGAGWQSKCNPQEFVAPFKVSGSELTLRWSDTIELQGFVNTNGKFRIEQPLQQSVNGIGSMMSDGAVTVILQGDISENTMKGLLMYGIAQFGNHGCSYPVSYAKS